MPRVITSKQFLIKVKPSYALAIARRYFISQLLQFLKFPSRGKKKIKKIYLYLL